MFFSSFVSYIRRQVRKTHITTNTYMGVCMFFHQYFFFVFISLKMFFPIWFFTAFKITIFTMKYICWALLFYIYVRHPKNILKHTIKQEKNAEGRTNIKKLCSQFFSKIFVFQSIMLTTRFFKYLLAFFSCFIMDWTFINVHFWFFSKKFLKSVFFLCLPWVFIFEYLFTYIM
jgi:hypothetical protein